MAASLPVTTRDAATADVPAICAIYGHYARHTLATWEYEAPSEAEMLERFNDRVAKGFPYIVAEQGGAIVGFASVGPFRGRAGWRFCVENSVYVDDKCHRRGIGSILLTALLEKCAAGGFRQVVASISHDPVTDEGAASIALHAKHGFKEVARFPTIGTKFEDRWLDAVFMQCAVGAGAATPPDNNALPAPLRSPPPTHKPLHAAGGDASASAAGLGGAASMRA